MSSGCIRAHEALCCGMRPEISLVEAGAAGLAYLTAAMEVVGPLDPNSTVLATGAARGVGGAVVGLARAEGARVISLVRGNAASNIAAAQSADEVIDPDVADLQD
ncbi:hypothetical protein [Nocardia sp. NPDC005745]|uniref:hypothetical protein n=1 Tax=Nocardia sp. NPDC005745 TaxID=3157061 RepID=UPI0033D2D91D